MRACSGRGRTPCRPGGSPPTRRRGRRRARSGRARPSRSGGACGSPGRSGRPSRRGRRHPDRIRRYGHGRGPSRSTLARREGPPGSMSAATASARIAAMPGLASGHSTIGAAAATGTAAAAATSGFAERRRRIRFEPSAARAAATGSAPDPNRSAAHSASRSNVSWCSSVKWLANSRFSAVRAPAASASREPGRPHRRGHNGPAGRRQPVGRARR